MFKSASKADPEGGLIKSVAEKLLPSKTNLLFSFKVFYFKNNKIYFFMYFIDL